MGLSRIGQEEGGKGCTGVYTPFCKIPSPWRQEGASGALPAQPAAPHIAYLKLAVVFGLKLLLYSVVGVLQAVLLRVKAFREQEERFPSPSAGFSSELALSCSRGREAGLCGRGEPGGYCAAGTRSQCVLQAGIRARRQTAQKH